MNIFPIANASAETAAVISVPQANIPGAVPQSFELILAQLDSSTPGAAVTLPESESIVATPETAEQILFPTTGEQLTLVTPEQTDSAVPVVAASKPEDLPLQGVPEVDSEQPVLTLEPVEEAPIDENSVDELPDALTVETAVTIEVVEELATKPQVPTLTVATPTEDELPDQVDTEIAVQDETIYAPTELATKPAEENKVVVDAPVALPVHEKQSQTQLSSGPIEVEASDRARIAAPVTKPVELAASEEAQSPVVAEDGQQTTVGVATTVEKTKLTEELAETTLTESPAIDDALQVTAEIEPVEQPVAEVEIQNGSTTPLISPTPLPANIVQYASHQAVADPTAIVSPQVVAKLETELAPLDQEETQLLKVELDPPELGHLKIQVEKTGENLVAQIVASEVVAAEMLLNEKDFLLETLAELGLEDASVNIGFEKEQDTQSEQEDSGQGQFVEFKSDLPMKSAKTQTRTASSSINIVA